MTIHSLYIFDRHCACIYFQAWNSTVSETAVGTVDPKTAEDSKLIYGTVFSLKNIINKLSPTPGLYS